MRIAILAAAAAVGLVTTAAAAQDTSFRGFRIEGNAGWDRFDVPAGTNAKFAFGGSGGFDGQIGRIVIGPEVNYWRPDDGHNAVGYLNGAGSQRIRSSHDELGAAVRVGYLLTPDLLLFGKGGYADDDQHRLAFSPTGALTRLTRDHVDGYQVGGGMEYTLHDRFAFAPAGVYLSAQYVYADYDNHTSDQHAMGGIGIRFK